jgi:hypothetical protein
MRYILLYFSCAVDEAAQLAVQVKALEIEKLRFQVAKLRRMQFGRSSERPTGSL